MASWSRPAPPTTDGTRLLPARPGGPSYRASTSVSRTSPSAWTRWATSAASRSLSPNRISSVATVSFSLTIGHDAELEQPVEGALGVRVVRAPRHVVGGEQHLADGEPVGTERPLVGRDEGSLTHAGRCLLGREVTGPAGQPERADAGGDGTGRDEHDLLAGEAPRREDVDELDQPGLVERPATGRRSATTSRP